MSINNFNSPILHRKSHRINHLFQIEVKSQKMYEIETKTHWEVLIHQ
jgi:hypothetical protein